MPDKVAEKREMCGAKAYTAGLISPDQGLCIRLIVISNFHIFVSQQVNWDYLNKFETQDEEFSNFG